MKPFSSEEAREFVHQLAFNWSQANLHSDRIAYVDFIRAINRLLTATGTAKETAYIFTGVINQASALSKTSEWVEGELRFEAQAAAVGNRPELLLSDLARLGPVDDASLDLYNERLHRFNQPSK